MQVPRVATTLAMLWQKTPKVMTRSAHASYHDLNFPTILLLTEAPPINALLILKNPVP